MIKREVSDEVSDEKTKPSRDINKQRFAKMSTAEINEIRTKAETKKKKKTDNIKWAAQVFERKM